MARKKREIIGGEEITEDQKFLDLAIRRFQDLYNAEFHIRETAKEDLEFTYNVGDGQWPESVRAEREEDKRPCLTFNKLRKHVAQVANFEREQRLAGRVRPVDDKADPDIAKVIEGLIRQIEYASKADETYADVGEKAIAGGFGYWRIITKEKDDSFDQEIFIEKIDNQFSCYLDPEGRYGFIRRGMSKKEFENEYPGKAVVGFEAGIGEEYLLWYEPDKIYIAEYFYKEQYNKTIAQCMNTQTGVSKIIELTNEITPELLAENGFIIIQQKTQKAEQVKWAKISAHEILERGDWAGKYIPIIEIVGDKVEVAGKTYKRSLIRDGKDPQRMFNYWLPLALNTPIPTPSGWSTMGEIKPGDKVFDDAGNICDVIGESPVHKNRQCFKVTFDDGTCIVADKEHPWQVEERGKRKSKSWDWTTKVITTEQLCPEDHFIYATRPLLLPDTKLPVDPYILGLWLGDGESTTGMITAGNLDIEETRGHVFKLGYEISPVQWTKNRPGRFTIYKLLPELKKLNLFKNKHIPIQYLRGSKEQRLSLLQGLMDTDGSISAIGSCSFTTTIDILRDGFAGLLRSLGIKAKHCIREPRTSTFNNKAINGQKQQYQFWFSPPKEFKVFRLKRKASKQDTIKTNFHKRRTQRYSIVSIDETPSVPVKCIKVSAESHLFLVGLAMIPTHNTHITEMFALIPKSPFIITPQQIKGFEAEWQNANKKTFPYLRYNPIGGTKPQREPPPQMQTGIGQILGIAEANVQDTIGMFEASFGQKSNERTGIAIQRRTSQSNFGTFHFHDNFRRAILETTKQLIDLIPKIYDTDRIERILGEEGEETLVPINRSVLNEKTGEKIIFNDLSVGKYDVVADTRLFATRRQESAQMMAETMLGAPNIAPLMIDLVFKYQDFPGAAELRKRLEKWMPQLMGQKDGQGSPSQTLTNEEDSSAIR